MRFDSYHPGINVLYFATMLFCTIAWDHPVFVALAYVCAFAYSTKLKGARQAVFNVALLVLGAAWALWFAATTHFGVTNLAMTIVGNAVTLESLVVGCVQGIKLVTVIMWLSCVFALFTADKVVFLLGKIAPKLSLFAAIVLRAVPVVKKQAHLIGTAQSCIGNGVGQGTLAHRLRDVVRHISVLVSWTIERFVQTSDSMRARGSALRGRTAYSLYRFDNKDRSVVLAFFILATICFAGAALDQTHILYNPEIIMNRITAASFVFYAAYAALCLLPLGLQIAGEVRFAKGIKGIA